MSEYVKLSLGVSISAIIGFIIYRKGALSISGLIGLLFFGTILFFFGGWYWFLILIAFLLSSSLLTKYRIADKRFLDDIVVKTGPRDIFQAAANASVGCILAVTYSIESRYIFYLAFLGSIAAVNADTWATEIGTLSKTFPRLITTWKTVRPGSSGGVTLLGTTVGIGGCLFIAFLGLIFKSVDSLIFHEELNIDVIRSIIIIVLSGFLGLMADSLLGATVQAKYYCPDRKRITEQISFRGIPTQYVSGVRWMNNDWVNFLSSIIGAVCALILSLL